MQDIGVILEKVRGTTNEEQLFEYSRSGEPGVVIEVAKHASATERILEALTRHPSIIVRHEVAKNTNTAIATLERLVKDKDMLVRDYARRNLVKKSVATP